jgi:uncharacterized membrane protein YdbT with pleckstrin-like domain
MGATMKYIRKRNLLETEELLYKPQLHWMFTIRHMVLTIPFFLLLLGFWALMRKYAGFFVWPGNVEISTFAVAIIIKYVFLAVLVLVLLVFICRIFQYLSTEYGVTNKRLIIKKGIIRVVITEIPFNRIESVQCLQGIMGRIFNYGTICISGVGGMKPLFYMVSRPYALMRKIADVMEKNKTVTVVHGRLPEITPPLEEQPVQREESVYRYGTFVRVLSENR